MFINGLQLTVGLTWCITVFIVLLFDHPKWSLKPRISEPSYCALTSPTVPGGYELVDDHVLVCGEFLTRVSLICLEEKRSEHPRSSSRLSRSITRTQAEYAVVKVIDLLGPPGCMDNCDCYGDVWERRLLPNGTYTSDGCTLDGLRITSIVGMEFADRTIERREELLPSETSAFLEDCLLL